MSHALVSVIIPTYNRSFLLGRAIESVIAQTVTDWEIVVVDDGSTDGTPALCDRYAATLDGRWTFVRQPRRGSSAARNRGIDLARGDFVAFLDSDDEFAPRKLERQLELIERRPDLDLVYSDFSFVDLEGVAHRSAFDEKFPLARTVEHETIGPGLCVCTGSLFDVLLRGYFIATIVGLVRREALTPDVRFGENLSYAEEWLFYLRVARDSRAGFVDEPLSIHHYTPGSLARTDKASNVARYHDVLRAMRCHLRDLTVAQRMIVRRNLASVSRQLGYEAMRGADRGEACRHFARALYELPSAGGVCDLTGVLSGLLWPRGFPAERVLSHPLAPSAR